WAACPPAAGTPPRATPHAQPEPDRPAPHVTAWNPVQGSSKVLPGEFDQQHVVPLLAGRRGPPEQLRPANAVARRGDVPEEVPNRRHVRLVRCEGGERCRAPRKGPLHLAEEGVVANRRVPRGQL